MCREHGTGHFFLNLICCLSFNRKYRNQKVFPFTNYKDFHENKANRVEYDYLMVTRVNLHKNISCNISFQPYHK